MINIDFSNIDYSLYIEAVVRAIALYFVILISLRALGKKDLGKLSLADFVLVLLVSKALDNDAGLGPGIAMVVSLAIINHIMDWAFFKSKKLKKIAVGEPVILIENGKIKPKALEEEMLTMDDLMEGIRRCGLDKISQVRWAILETNGEISILRADKDK
jgi:uncharacterized membrane protein YcaP (DUF421 family)